MSWITLYNNEGTVGYNNRLGFKIQIRPSSEMEFDESENLPQGDNVTSRGTRTEMTQHQGARIVPLDSNYSVSYDPSRLREGRLINVSLRLFEQQADTEIVDYHDQHGFAIGVRFVWKMRLFETSLNDLAAGRIRFITFSFGAVGIHETPNYWNMVGCRWNRRAAISNRIKGEFKIKLDGSESRALVRIRRSCQRLRDLVRREADVSDQIRRTRRQMRRDSRLIAEYRRRRLRVPQAIRDRLRTGSQSLERALVQRQNIRDTMRVYGNRIQRLGARVSGGFGRALSRRVMTNELAKLGRRLLGRLVRLIPILNLVAAGKDLIDTINALHDLFHGRRRFGFEQGAEEAAENPADSLEEADINAPDTPSEDSSLGHASRGLHDRGREARTRNEERGLDLNQDQDNPTPESIDEGARETTGYPEDTAEGMETESGVGMADAPVEEEPAIDRPMTDLEIADFIARHQNIEPPLFKPTVNDQSTVLSSGDTIPGILMLRYDGRLVAGQTTVRIRQLGERQGNRQRITFSHPRFTAMSRTGDIVSIVRGGGTFTLRRDVVRRSQAP